MQLQKIVEKEIKQMMELHKSRDKNKGVNRITNQHKKKEGPLTLELQNNKIIKKGINGVPRGEQHQ